MPDNPLLTNTFADLLQPGSQSVPDASQGPAPAATFSTGTTDTNVLPTTPSGMEQGDAQKAMVSWMQQLSGMLDPNSQSNKDMDARMKALQYTPEQRTQDLYNKMFGITKDDQGKTHRNWLKTITGGLGEVARGSLQKGAYVPPMERLRGEATKEYAAETQPLVHELQYGMQDRRSLENNLSKTLGTLGTSIKSADQTAVANRNSNLKAEALKLAQDLEPAKRREFEARIEKENSEVGLNKIKQDAAQASMAATSNKMNQSIANMGQTGMFGMIARIQTLRQQGKAAEADALQKSMLETVSASRPRQQYVPTEGGGGMVFDRGTGGMSPVRGGGGSPVLDASGQPAQDPSVSQAVRQHFNGRIPMGNVQYANMPKDMTPQSAAILQAIPMSKPLGGDDLNRANAASLGHQNANSLLDLLEKMDPKKFGTMAGNWEQYVKSNTSAADPDVRRFLETAQQLGSNHAKAQGIGASGFMEDLGKRMAKLGTNKAALAGGIDTYDKTFADTLSRYPEFKGRYGNGMDAVDALRTYHPDLYEKELQAKVPSILQAEMARRIRFQGK